MPIRYDPKSIAGKQLTVQETCQLLVVGAGAAGIAAATQAAQLGLKVVLADENPVSAETMGDDIPLHFGQRFAAAARNHTAMLEAFIAHQPALEDVFNVGVDVRLGTSVWGLYVNGPSVGWLPGPVAGLMHEGQCIMLGCERVIVATGRRDMGLSFPGWELPGVLGVTAAQRLAQCFGVLDARRAVVLGTSAETLEAARSLRHAGIEIAAFVEVAPAPVGPAALMRELADVPLLCGHSVRRVEGGLDGVESVVIVPIVGDGVAPAPAQSISCDVVLLGVGTVPVIDLLDAVGCRTVYAPERGGYVPLLNNAQQTAVPSFYAAGDCAGIWADKTLDPEIARAEGRRAAVATAISLGFVPTPVGPPSPPNPPAFDLDSYRMDWVRATVLGGSNDPYVCQCEEVTAREIMELRPPRYLGWPDDRRNARSLTQMLGDAPPNPDQVKRLTRAGMGLCQGRRCREQVAAILALAAGKRLGDIPLASYRAPVRPIPLSVAAETQEPAEMTRHWDTWFGMPSQYVPYWEAPRFYTAADRPSDDQPTDGK
jgi:thioredoxin reductase